MQVWYLINEMLHTGNLYHLYGGFMMMYCCEIVSWIHIDRTFTKKLCFHTE